MKIKPIQQNNSNFGAKIYKTAALAEAVDYMSTNCTRKDYTKHLELWKKIEKGIEKHPSNLDVFTIVERDMGDYGYAAGSVKTFIGEMAFKTRASQGILRSILGVWRDFLDPVNIDRFNVIMGKRSKKEYKTWWNEYIAPYWDDINKYFGDGDSTSPTQTGRVTILRFNGKK